MGERAYSWHPPVAWRGDRVRFRLHRGGIAVGKVRRVETWYGFGPTDGSARHSYAIVREGRDRTEWHGDGDILEVLAARPDEKGE